ncbi:ATP-grasp domain-containing protein [[Clostridium] polysaccharolyticum]|uniref:Gamma-F420-2:alpha-L-glutamate ligase n=1 Tax=[Clostridium] polysaccharolyticum TaxID=29364 RepID=A0A1I0AGI7_9FIRM|nr:ATP-grasp domain-containing protein [[Clostridium] polysaccharolyticum]SES93370.1 gamma-F420-2:alpha-L-glutamate ligase [[Clostridium] polysaccharolyticum]
MEEKKLHGWILYNKEDAKRNEGYIEFHKVEGEKLGIDIELMYIEDMEFGVQYEEWYLLYEGKELEKPDFAIVRMNYPLLSRQLELMDIPVFNSSFVASVCNDKAQTYQYVAKTGVAMVDSQFVHKNFLLSKISSVPRPFVVKSVSGHGGSQVFLVEEGQEIMPIYEKLDDHVVIQPFASSRKQDLRVYIVGNEIVGAVLRTGTDGFRSNFSLGGKAEFYTLEDEEKEIVERIIDLFDFGLAGIDFIIGDNGALIFNEIEDVVGSRMLYSCSDINIVALYLEYIKKQLYKRL